MRVNGIPNYISRGRCFALVQSRGLFRRYVGYSRNIIYAYKCTRYEPFINYGNAVNLYSFTSLLRLEYILLFALVMCDVHDEKNCVDNN